MCIPVNCELYGSTLALFYCLNLKGMTNSQITITTIRCYFSCFSNTKTNDYNRNEYIE